MTERELRDGATVGSLIAGVAGVCHGRGIAVAVDGEVVPRGAWGAVALSEGARVEIVAAVQGG